MDGGVLKIIFGERKKHRPGNPGLNYGWYMESYYKASVNYGACVYACIYTQVRLR